MSSTNIFTIEEFWRDGDPVVEEEIATYVVKNEQKESIVVVDTRISYDSEIDALVINQLSILVDPNDILLTVATERMANILANLADEGIITPSEPVHAGIPGEYFLNLRNPHKLSNAYYQKGYYEEIDEWTENFLQSDGTIARIIAMIESEKA
ncbi:MAG: hypothetical protein IH880_03120 [Candidatus Marinimicrobia bacterium]|nr:hypothetical protein [Candidatus Neomarinimicrobiota bacterium]